MIHCTVCGQLVDHLHGSCGGTPSFNPDGSPLRIFGNYLPDDAPSGLRVATEDLWHGSEEVRSARKWRDLVRFAESQPNKPIPWVVYRWIDNAHSMTEADRQAALADISRPEVQAQIERLNAGEVL